MNSDLIPVDARTRPTLERIVQDGVAARQRAKDAARQRAVWLGCIARANATAVVTLGVTLAVLLLARPGTQLESTIVLMTLLGATGISAGIAAGVGVLTFARERQARAQLRAAAAQLSPQEARELVSGEPLEALHDQRDVLALALHALSAEPGELVPAAPPTCDAREMTPSEWIERRS